MQNLSTKFKALAWMLFGLFFVFSTVIIMNKSSESIQTKTKEKHAEFNMQKVVKAKPKPKPKPKKKKKPAKAKRSTPSPNLSSSLSGIDTGLDSFMSQDIDDDSLLGDVDKDVVMSEDSVDKAPQPAQRAPLEYPKNARKMGVTGYVLMNILVNKNGDVEEVKVLEAQPDGVFEDVAIQSVRQWSFKPAQYKGQNVKVWAKQKIRFDLQ